MHVVIIWQALMLQRILKDLTGNAHFYIKNCNANKMQLSRTKYILARDGGVEGKGRSY